MLILWIVMEIAITSLSVHLSDVISAVYWKTFELRTLFFQAFIFGLGFYGIYFDSLAVA